ncbi:MAG TPA: CHAD domain-containing protein [Candidatus Methylomirabilis sp.]|nr:CHAD domain-containing protein [Candidatus Methylomirabilis sp.]
MATAVTASRSPLSLAALRSPFAVPSQSGPRPEHRGLSFWMNRVLEELETLRTSPEAETVHDLRVAIRRCRSLAVAMEEVDPDPAWPQTRKVARRLFRGLGAWRDAQVLEDWIKKLIPESDPLGTRLLSSLAADEKQRSETALRVAAKFDDKQWIELERQLRKRSRLIPAGSLAAECLALERFEEAKELHNRALRTEKAKPWHALRIGVKRFRYTVEGLLPDHYAAWSENLKRIQDLLGDIHDLDVFQEKLGSEDSGAAAESMRACEERAARERSARIETYRQLTLGKTSLWHEWRHNLPYGQRLEAAVTARIRATARAGDAHRRRTGQVARLALRLFDILRRANATPFFSEPAMRRVLQAAAKLHGIGTVGEHTQSQKEVRKYLLGLAVPPNWTSDEWDLMAWAVRFHRGAEPKEKNGFAKLSEDKKNAVRALAGILRLARALRKEGVDTTRGLRSEKSADAFVLRVPGLADTAESAARLAAAKHLLELALAKPLILKLAPLPDKESTSEEPVSEPPVVAA